MHAVRGMRKALTFANIDWILLENRTRLRDRLLASSTTTVFPASLYVTGAGATPPPESLNAVFSGLSTVGPGLDFRF